MSNKRLSVSNESIELSEFNVRTTNQPVLTVERAQAQSCGDVLIALSFRFGFYEY